MTTSVQTADRASSFPIGDSLTLDKMREDALGIALRLLSEEPVTWIPGVDIWFISKHALAMEVYQDTERFIKDFPGNTEKAHGDSMLSLDEPQHSVNRAPFNRGFRPTFIAKNLAGIIDEHVQTLIDQLATRNSADLVRQLAGPLALRVIRDGMGFDFPDDHFLEELIETFVKAVQADADDGSRAALDKQRSEIVPAVLRALQSNRNTVLGTFNERRPEDYTDDMVIVNVMNLILGGAETTATMISTTLWELLNHPDAFEEVRKDRSLVEASIREALRLHPAFGYSVRAAAVDTEIGGVQIKAGERVYPLLIAINRDPEVFEAPDTYDIHRKDARKSLYFGTGIHSCIGQHLALAVTASAVNALLDRVQGLRLDTERPSEPTSFEMHRLPRIDVQWDHIADREADRSRHSD